MINYNEILKIIKNNYLENLLNRKIYKEYFNEYVYFKDIYDKFQDISNVEYNLNSDVITIGEKNQLNDIENFTELLKFYNPWKKGPFEIFGIFIDTEWRSDFKWNRLKNHITPLKNRKILDVGCGSGYHCLRMKGENAKFVIGIEPYFKFLAQFYLLQKYLKIQDVAVFPLKCEEMQGLKFDTIFSMGVLYHRISPIEHLMQLKTLLDDNGELVLETLIIKDNQQFLMPKDRYAKMKNVWFIPSIKTLHFWLEKTGFKNIRCVDINETTTQEQKCLGDFLDKTNPSKTIEGYPRPQRAIFIANK